MESQFEQPKLGIGAGLPPRPTLSRSNSRSRSPGPLSAHGCPVSERRPVLTCRLRCLVITHQVRGCRPRTRGHPDAVKRSPGSFPLTFCVDIEGGCAQGRGLRRRFRASICIAISTSRLHLWRCKRKRKPAMPQRRALWQHPSFGRTSRMWRQFPACRPSRSLCFVWR
eukprot:779997-Rhodomonas_salina.2